MGKVGFSICLTESERADLKGLAWLSGRRLSSGPSPNLAFPSRSAGQAHRSSGPSPHRPAVPLHLRVADWPMRRPASQNGLGSFLPGSD